MHRRSSYTAHSNVVSIATGIITGISIQSPGLWWLVFFSVSLFFYHITIKSNQHNYFWYGFLFGVSKMMVILLWGFGTYPITWLGDFHPLLAGLLIGLYWITAAVTIGCATGLATGLLMLLKGRAFWSLILSLGLVLSEILGALLYSIVFSGPGSYLQSYFSFGFVGYALAHSDYFLTYALIAGVFSLSFITYLAAALIAQGIHLRIWYPLAIVVMISLVPYILVSEYEVGGNPVRIIDTSVTAASLQNPAGHIKKRDAINDAVSYTAKIYGGNIVLPEDSRFVPQFEGTSELMRWFSDQGISQPLFLYDSGRTTADNGDTVLRGYVVESSSQTVNIFDKNYLVPQGEFMPFFALGALHLFSSSKWYSRVLEHLSYRPSTYTEYSEGSQAVAFLFCFEAVNPFGVKQALKRQPSQFIVHPVSHTWFSSGSASLRNQLVAMLRTQAMWQQVPIVVAGNEFEGFIVLPDGTIDAGSVDIRKEMWLLRTVYW